MLTVLPMVVRILISPPYLQFFICDASRPENPVQGETIGIVSNGACLSVPCAYHDEEETELIVGPADEIAEAGAPRFDGAIPTRSRRLVFDDAAGTEWLSYPVTGPSTRIRIWTDGSMLPNRVVVAVG